MKLNRKAIASPFTLVLLFSNIASFADYEEGVEAAFSGDFDTAFREFTSAAEDGLSLAQYNLGILYFTGQGVSKNLEEAFKWTKAAAEQGHLNAQFNLGCVYKTGCPGIEQDLCEALKWFTRAAKQGDEEARVKAAEVVKMLKQQG